jgi:hypothetical protein
MVRDGISGAWFAVTALAARRCARRDHYRLTHLDVLV